MEGVLDVFWQSSVWLSCSRVLPLVYASLLTRHIYIHEGIHIYTLLVVDFDIDSPAFSRVFLTSVDVVKGTFFAKERILGSSTSVVFRGLPGLLDVVELTSAFLC